MSLPMRDSRSGLPTMTARPPDTTTASPVNAICVPSVHRIGVILNRAISTPLTIPPARPITSASPMNARLKPSWFSALEMNIETITAESTPARLARAIPERSIPPLPAHIASITPIANSPISGTWPAIDCRLNRDRKDPPEIYAPSASNPRLMTTSIAS